MLPVEPFDDIQPGNAGNLLVMTYNVAVLSFDLQEASSDPSIEGLDFVRLQAHDVTVTFRYQGGFGAFELCSIEEHLTTKELYPAYLGSKTLLD